MRFGHSEVCLSHDPGSRHPESPDRLRAIRRRLTNEHAATFTDADDAPLELLEAVHDETYLEELEEFCAAGGGEWDPDTIATADTWGAARRSAGLAVWAAREAVAGAEGRETPFAVGRPPGHHAEPAEAMGFCFLNNVAIATAAARTETEIQRVAIIDWDVHHGNGTQAAFLEAPDVLYTSIHEEGLYPGTGAIDEIGSGDGAGTTVNIGLPSGAGDPEYEHAFANAVKPIVSAFEPDLILTSAGFDPHRHDPISRMRLSTEGFGVLTQDVIDIAEQGGAALGFVLEGGYGLDTLSEGVAMVNKVFEGYEPVYPDGDPAEAVRERVRRVRDVHDL
jgi:acetoin utilization deacetylase AcuC-like enzyme